MNDQAEPTDEVRQRWRQTLRAAGLKSTQPRLAVLEILEIAGRPLTHKDVADRLVDRCLDKATIFRILTDLCEASFVRRFDVGDHTWRYELVRNCDAPHAHLVCESCGSLTCLDAMPIALAADRLLAATGNHLIQDVLLKGVCSNCRQADATKELDHGECRR